MDIGKENYMRSVSEVQTSLRRLSYKYPQITFVGTDGIFGSETKQAVTDFQKIFGLRQTGEVNRETWDAIMREYRSLTEKSLKARKVGFYKNIGRAYNKGDRGDGVFALQIMQNSLFGKINGIRKQPVTGIYNDVTANNTMIVQKAAALPQTGRADRATWDAHVIKYEEL